MARGNKHVTVTEDNVDAVMGSIEALSKIELQIGVPAETSPRGGEGGINNASLAYIHEHGAPEANIPARPFLQPTLAENQDTLISPAFVKAGRTALDGEKAKAEAILARLGQQLADRVRTKILSQIPPPLKPGTVLRRTTRLAKYRGASAKRKKLMRENATSPAGLASATPLWDTGQMARAITYVIKKVKGVTAPRRSSSGRLL